MIKSVKILNFQSHEKSKLDFSPGVNVIVGCSDSGKTAIIRALRWLSWNRPSGDSIRSHWGGATNVLVETEEGIVRRSKDKKDSYELLLKGRKNLVFHAFGTNVPQEITTFLNLSEINLQQQLDSPFLLSRTSGEVAQHFNRIAHLDKIDKGMQTVQRFIREIETQIKFERQNIETYKEDLKQYDHLEQFETEVETLEQLGVLRNNKARNRNRLQTLLDDIQQKSQEIQEASVILTLEPTVNRLLELYDKRKTVESDRNKLFKLVSSVRRVSVSLETEKAKLTTLQTKFDREFPDVCPLCGKPKTK